MTYASYTVYKEPGFSTTGISFGQSQDSEETLPASSNAYDTDFSSYQGLRNVSYRYFPDCVM